MSKVWSGIFMEQDAPICHGKVFEKWRILCLIEMLDRSINSLDFNLIRDCLETSQRCNSTWPNMS